MLALRAPAVRARAVRARAVRLRAGRVVCLCSARLHRATLADTASLVDPGDLTCPFPILSHMGLLSSCIVPPSLPFLACVVPPLPCFSCD